MTAPIDWSLSLGRNVRKARLAKGWSMREFAGALEASPSYLCDIEKDRRVPAEMVLKAIALLVGFDEADILVKAGRMSEDVQRYVDDHPAVLRLVAEIANAGLHDEEIHQLIDRVKGATTPCR
jgi:transcriptional regulator with XRE-family HTH domain